MPYESVPVQMLSTSVEHATAYAKTVPLPTLKIMPFPMLTIPAFTCKRVACGNQAYKPWKRAPL